MRKKLRLLLRKQEESFIQSWSVGEKKKDYNALQDPHASFYFHNRSVNEHLRTLSKVFLSRLDIGFQQIA